MRVVIAEDLFLLREGLVRLLTPTTGSAALHARRRVPGLPVLVWPTLVPDDGSG